MKTILVDSPLNIEKIPDLSKKDRQRLTEMFEKIETSAEVLADSADRLSKSSVSILKLMRLVLLGGPLTLACYLGYTNRDNIVPAIYKALTTQDAPALVTEWDLISPDTFPEFYACSTNSCVSDYSKKHLVKIELNKLLTSTKASRSVFFVYGIKSEQIALQEVAPGYEKYSKEFWHVPVIGEIKEKVAGPHAQNICSNWREDILTGPYLTLKAQRYGIIESRACPVNAENVRITGYISLDFNIKLSADQASKVDAALKETAENIQDIMGFSRPLATQKTVNLGRI